MNSNNYDFRREVYSDIVVEVVLAGRATSNEAEDFKNILSSDIDLGTRRLIVNLSACEYMDSAFTGAIVVSLRRISAVGGDLRLVGLQQGVRNMLELTRIIHQFDVFPNIEAAIESYGGQGSSGLRNNRLTIR